MHLLPGDRFTAIRKHSVRGADVEAALALVGLFWSLRLWLEREAEVARSIGTQICPEHTDLALLRVVRDIEQRVRERPVLSTSRNSAGT